MNNFTEFGPSLETTIKKNKILLLQKVGKNNKNDKRVIMPTDFNPNMPVASSVQQKHHKSMLFVNPNLKEIFPEPPMPALRQPKTLSCDKIK